MAPLLIYTRKTSARLVYVLDWVFNERLGIHYQIVQNAAELEGYSFAICYGVARKNCFCVPDSGLLWDTGTKKIEIIKGEWLGTPTLFHTNESTLSTPFDIFSAIFFLLSRYEEYWPFTPDKHQRYPPEASVLYSHLDRPIVDEWITALKGELIAAGVSVTPKKFSFLPTYDIDIAWSYKNKGFTRSAGATLRNVLTGRVEEIRNRIAVLSGRAKDPYDSFDALTQLHQKHSLSPIYFILSATATTSFDKNIPLSHPEMRTLVKRLAKDGAIGIHPSYNVDKNSGLLATEKKRLENVIQSTITISRQHYIKLSLPGTYHLLVLNGIKYDYSMGYGSRLGFRAGTGNSFLWFDLSNNAATSLRVHPFCFMDTTAHYDECLSVKEAFKKLDSYTRILKQTDSQLIIVFHNFSLGTDAEWKGWKKNYEAFIAEYAEYATS